MQEIISVLQVEQQEWESAKDSTHELKRLRAEVQALTTELEGVSSISVSESELISLLDLS